MGVNMGASHTGLHSITISLCCHGNQALSSVKISHCSRRGLMCEHAHKHTCLPCRRGKRPAHLVLMLSRTLTSLLHGSADASSHATGLQPQRARACENVHEGGSKQLYFDSPSEALLSTIYRSLVSLSRLISFNPGKHI